MTAGPSNLVLLFYDGHEHRAEPSLARRLPAELRRHARHLVKTIQRKQTKSGFYTWFHMLRDALKGAGLDVRVNDFATAARFPDHPIGAAGYPSVLDKLASLPNPRLVGPGFYASPLENTRLFDDPRNVFYIATCDWYADMFKPFYGDRLRRWFGGFDLDDFPDTRGAEKTYDVLIYDKIYFNRDAFYPATIASLLKHLEAQGLSSVVFRYGSYHYRDYIAALAASRSMAFFAHSETQGMAYQECLAMNVPICAWDEGVWQDPKAAELSHDPIPCTSVPYFDARCGERFKAAGMIETWDRFWSRLGGYEPRAFVGEQLTLARSADAYLAAYRETGQSVAAKRVAHA